MKQQRKRTWLRTVSVAGTWSACLLRNRKRANPLTDRLIAAKYDHKHVK